MTNIKELPKILRVDLDCDIDTERLDVYGSTNWTADSAGDYERQEKLINDYVVKGSFFTLYCWCDVSGYHYWVEKQEEPNYLMITIQLHKELLTEPEIQELRMAILECDAYFQANLTDGTHLYID